MASETVTLNAPPVATVGEFMLGRSQRPVLLLEQVTKEVTYILSALSARSPPAGVSFFALRRKITDHAASSTTEEEVVSNIPHLVSLRAILEPILAQYPAARRFF